MALGRRVEQQRPLFVLADELPKSDGHPFYRKLNALLVEAGFHRWIERLCRLNLGHRSLFPTPVMELVPDGHLAHAVLDTVREEINLDAVLSTYEEKHGFPPNYPTMTTALRSCCKAAHR